MFNLKNHLRAFLAVSSFLTLHGGTVKHYCPHYCLCFMWQNLRKAECVNQNIITIDIDVSQYTEALDVSHNYIMKLENGVFTVLGLIHLQYLNLHNNHIKDIEMYAFSGLNDLQLLDLSNNHLRYLFTRTFEDLQNLKVLYLYGNKFNTWDLTLSLKSLKVLDLSNCNIENIDHKAFVTMKNLENVNLSNNQISDIKINLISPLEKLKMLNFSRNPLKCNEHTNKLQSWLDAKKIKHTIICLREKEKGHNEIKDKFERMISVTDDTFRYMGANVSDFWTFENKESELSGYNKTFSFQDCSSKKQHYLFTVDFFDKIPSFWSFIIGLFSGIVISVTIFLLCMLSEHFRSPRNHLMSQHALLYSTGLGHFRSHTPSVWEISESETPPPAYRDVVCDQISRYDL